MAKTAKRTVGKPKREFSDAQIKKMKELAFAGCQTLTIASIMGIPRETIDSRPDIQRLLTKKRADRKLTLRQQQNKTSKDGNVTMQIWLGKQVLDQTDKLNTKHGVDDESMGRLLEILDGKSRGLPK